jgi:hypothetical protein
MGDAHGEVVADDREVVGGHAAPPPNEDPVVHLVVRDGDLAADQVRELRRPVRDAEAHREGLPSRGPARGLRGVELAVVTAVRDALLARLLLGAPGLLLLGGGEVAVHEPLLEQALKDLVVGRAALALEVGLVGTAHIGALVPVEAQPLQTLEDRVEGLLGVALGVGVLDPQEELALAPACEGPVEEGRAAQAEVDGAGRARGDADADGHGRRGAGGRARAGAAGAGAAGRGKRIGTGIPRAGPRPGL